MINATGSALSGIKACGTKIGVTANNIANMNTDGFKKSRAVLEEGHLSGVTVSIEEIDTPGAILPAQDGSGETRETSNVDLEEEAGNLITTRTALSANIKTLRTWDEMTESLIDLLA
jgi:flagellar hook protein FlgE